MSNINIAKNKTLSFLLVFSTLVFLSCKENEEVNPFLLQSSKISDLAVFLSWNEIEGAEDYKVWRIINKGFLLTPELIGTVEPSIQHYTDDNQPLSPSVIYYVTTNVDGHEKRSNDINVKGSDYLPILPYQMELINETNLAIVREYGSIILLDYEKQLIIKKLDFPGKVGQFDLTTNGTLLELYVPCSDNNLYILRANDLNAIDTLDTSGPVASVAVNNLGKIFCSGYYGGGLLKIYERESLSLITQISFESDCGLYLKNDHNLVAISSHLSPAKMSYLTFDNNGFLISKTDDPYHSNYEMESNRTKVSDKYILSSREGFIYTADHNMTYVTKLVAGSFNQSDFAFSADETIIYSAITNQRIILKSTITNNVASSSTIATHGYPWIISRKENQLIVLSSPTAFQLNSLTNKIIIEKVAVQ